MKKIFISQPMRGWKKEEILAFRNIIKMNLKNSLNEDIEIIDSYFEDYPREINKNIPIYHLGKSIELLSQADIAYFGGDWKNARGCQIEYAICKKYGIETIEEWDGILIHTGDNLV